MKKEIKRIIVSSTAGVKETLFSIPSFFLVKRMYPDADLVLVTKKESYDIVKNLPYIDRFFVLDDYKKAEIEGKIAYFNADVFLAFYSDSIIERLAKASGAGVKIGPITSISSFFIYGKGSIQKRKKSIKSEVYYNLDLVKKLNKKSYKDNYEINNNLYLSSGSKVVADTFFRETNLYHNTLVVSPFNDGNGKNLSDEQYVNLIKRIKERNKDRKIILICNIEEEIRINKMIDEINMSGIYPFPNGGDLLNIAGIINKGMVYLGPLSGITIMAGMVKKSTIAIYSKKEEIGVTRWGLFENDKVVYIIPDKNNPKENYKSNYFSGYNKEIEDDIVAEIEKAFKSCMR
ncbi:glycosyltransferase family 9 protein [Fusobacterium sp. PH5-44]|uniref:glycosyltransferase family 9 protein n=1 Tax=unclassified Fusobacterium TaxID=2648384 RepID=UPI003D209ECF